MLTPLYACPAFYAASRKKKLEDGNKKKQNYHIYSQILFSCFEYQWNTTRREFERFAMEIEMKV